MTGGRIEAFAQRLAEAWTRGVELTAADCPAQSAAQAYAVQDALVERLPAFAARAPAWKVGLTSAQATPTAAPLPSDRLHATSMPTPQAHDLSVEAEVAFELDAQGRPQRIGAAIEVAGSRYVEGVKAPAVARLADLQSHVALIVGAMNTFDPIDWAEQRCIVHVNGVEVASSVGSHPCGDPLAALPWLLAHAAQRRMPLRAGAIVTTGAWTGMHPVRAGDRIVVEFPGIGRAALELAR